MGKIPSFMPKTWAHYLDVHFTMVGAGLYLFQSVKISPCPGFMSHKLSKAYFEMEHPDRQSWPNHWGSYLNPPPPQG